MVGESIISKRRLKRQIRDQNQSVSVSNATNSRLPDDLKSRIFIGNLNTTIVTKRHLHILFIQFGDIKAISMHKGYAFIQYGDEMDAVNAVFAQDGQLIAGQSIDVNLVTEPKPHQKGSRSSQGFSVESESSIEMTTSIEMTAETNSLNNSESDSNCSNLTYESGSKDLIMDEKSSLVDDATSITPSLPQCSVSFNNIENKPNSVKMQECEGHAKRVKLDCDKDLSLVSANDDQLSSLSHAKSTDEICGTQDLLNSYNLSLQQPLVNNPLMPRSTSNPFLEPGRTRAEAFPLALNQMQSHDILICGNCRSFFTSLPLFIEHKRISKCRLRFVCHCHHT